MKHGKIIIPCGVFPERHELETASFFAETGTDVEFLPPSYVKGVYSPDIQMDGQRWEIKSPCGSSKRTIENNYRNAQKQSGGKTVPGTICTGYFTLRYSSKRGAMP
jgi:hypothetical protein